jgi:hypothetical protein
MNSVWLILNYVCKGKVPINGLRNLKTVREQTSTRRRWGLLLMAEFRTQTAGKKFQDAWCNCEKLLIKARMNDCRIGFKKETDPKENLKSPCVGDVRNSV